MQAEQARSPLFEMNPDEGTASSKRLSVERIYQKKTQLEHILLRPDTYIGSVEEVVQPMWVYDEVQDAIVERQIKFVPGLYKIFDEILVNAADNKQRDPNMNALKVVIDRENNLISVWNNGRGIPVEMHKKEQMYVPSMIFGHLLTSSNYDDKQKKVTGGRNGYGAKLCNIFSTTFTVETACSSSKKAFKQVWTGNMSKAGEAKIAASTDDYTKVSFKPDLPKFGMDCLNRDMVALLTRRVYDLAGCLTGVKVYLNGKRVPISSFKQYVELYLKVRGPDDDEDVAEIPKVVSEKSGRWEVCVTVSSKGFQQASFVNSIATTKGGKHVDHVVDPLVAKIAESVKKKNKGGMELRPFQIKSHMWIFVNCLIENPAFDSQTKENMTLKVSAFGSKFEPSEKFVREVLKSGIVENCIAWAQAKSKVQLNKMRKGAGPKNSRLRGIAKLDDANSAGGKNSRDCTLIVTEGDSAKALAVSGLGIVGRDCYGVFPLRGKLLNVREATHKQLMGNEEIINLVKILGLEFGKKYTEEGALKALRYGHLMIMADQDQDGSHIKGLVINFIHHNWPHLLKFDFMQEFITPIVKATKGGSEQCFFSLPEFERWKTMTDGTHTWRIKYYKGLGTSTSAEAKTYFSDMDRHCIQFKYTGREDDEAIELAFAKDKSDSRKVWLTNWLSRRREKREQGVDESFLYGERVDHVTFSEFVNKELILFSNADNERSIPSLVDGLKPGQRKVLFTCFKRNDKREVKVAQLAGSVAELSAYHHGEVSLMSTIINLAQDFVGTNNVNLLQPLGQFGTRLAGGKDAASPRYIFTLLSPLARRLFNSDDDHGLNFLTEDNLSIEPEWYCPILPTVLINGCDGIGTGYSTTVPNHDPREVVDNLKRMMNGMEPLTMVPKYKNFGGTIAHVAPNRYSVYGNIARLSATELEITELPIRRWTQDYKEQVLEVLLHGSEKVEPFISDYKEYHTDTTVKFVVSLSEQRMIEAEREGFHKKFKLEGAVATSNMVLFDPNGCLRRFSDSGEILKEFFDLRLERYRSRKEYLEGKLQAEADKITSQARFVMEMYNGTIVFRKQSKSQMVALLKERGYPGDPVKSWKARIAADADAQDEEEEEGSSEQDEKSSDYNYLLGMAMWNMSLEKKNELMKEKEKKVEELRILKSKSPKDLWCEDLDSFIEALNEVEEQEKQQQMSDSRIKPKGKAKKGSRQAKLTSQSSVVQSVSKPSPFAEVIPPQIPEFKIPAEKKERKPKTAPSQPKGTGGLKQGKLAFKEAEMKTASAFDDDSGDEMAPLPSKPVQRMKKEVVTLSDSEDEGMEVVEQKATKVDRPARKRPAKVCFGGDDDSVSSDDAYEDTDDDFSPVMSKKATASAKGKDSPVKGAKSAGIKKAVKQISKSSQKNLLMGGGSAPTTSQEEGEENVEEPVKPKKPAAKPKAVVQKKKGGKADSDGDGMGTLGSKKSSKQKTAGKRRKEEEDDSEDETVAVKRKRPAPQKGASKKAPKPKQTKSATVVRKSESEEDSDVPLMERLKRNKKQVKYFDDEEEEEKGEDEIQFSGMESDNGSDWNEDQDDSDYN